MAYRLYNARYPGRPVHSSHMFELFDRDATSKWPAEGLPERMLRATDTSNGTAVEVRAWVVPFVPKTRKNWELCDVPVKSSTHRVMCACPGCGRVLSAGRLFQHLCAT